MVFKPRKKFGFNKITKLWKQHLEEHFEKENESDVSRSGTAKS